VVESAEDVLAELRGSSLRPQARDGSVPEPSDALVACMQPGESYDVESLGRATGLPASQLLSKLLGLELQGVVRRVDGGRFVRARRTC
jgi:predicted Rossmann fold nucleotide-binding protein DprA/Smf involved in DNA uptake